MRLQLGFSCVILGAVLASGCSSSNRVLDDTRDVVGSGIIATEDRVVNGFSSVTFASEGSLDIFMGGAETLGIATDDNLLEHLFTEVAGATLTIRTESGVDLIPSGTVDFNLTAVNLDEVLHAGVGEVEVFDVAQPALSLTLAGVGSLSASNLDVEELAIGHTGVGDVTVSGTADVQDISVSGVGVYDAITLRSAEATVVLNGLGTVLVHATDVLDVTIVGDGVVRYLGSPLLTVNVTGNGTVEQIAR